MVVFNCLENSILLSGQDLVISRDGRGNTLQWVCVKQVFGEDRRLSFRSDIDLVRLLL